MKPPAELELQPKKHNKANDNEGKEGMANEEDPFPHKVEAPHKVLEPSGHPTKRAGLMTNRAIWPVRRQELQGTLVPHAHKSVRQCLPLLTKVLLPGCSFP